MLARAAASGTLPFQRRAVTSSNPIWPASRSTSYPRIVSRPCSPSTSLSAVSVMTPTSSEFEDLVWVIGALSPRNPLVKMSRAAPKDSSERSKCRGSIMRCIVLELFRWKASWHTVRYSHSRQLGSRKWSADHEVRHEAEGVSQGHGGRPARGGCLLPSLRPVAARGFGAGIRDEPARRATAAPDRRRRPALFF